VIKTLEVLGNFVGHADVNNALFVVPVECEANIQVTRPIYGDGVLIKGVSVRMFIVNVFNATIVNNKTERDGSGDMVKVTRY
jgi:hypothetical protein